MVKCLRLTSRYEMTLRKFSVYWNLNGAFDQLRNARIHDRPWQPPWNIATPRSVKFGISTVAFFLFDADRVTSDSSNTISELVTPHSGSASRLEYTFKMSIVQLDPYSCLNNVTNVHNIKIWHRPITRVSWAHLIGSHYTSRTFHVFFFIKNYIGTQGEDLSTVKML